MHGNCIGIITYLASTGKRLEVVIVGLVINGWEVCLENLCQYWRGHGLVIWHFRMSLLYFVSSDQCLDKLPFIWLEVVGVGAGGIDAIALDGQCIQQYQHWMVVAALDLIIPRWVGKEGVLLSIDLFHCTGNHFLLLPDANSGILDWKFELLCPHCFCHDSRGNFQQ